MSGLFTNPALPCVKEELDRMNRMNKIKGKAAGFFALPCLLNLDNHVHPVSSLRS
jgi:hypothetical protein